MRECGFTKSGYENERFQDVVADKVRLEDMSFYKCAFAGCSFQYAAFFHCSFESCVFTGCNLSLVELSGSTIIDTAFEDCKLMGVNWGNVGKIFSAQYESCMLDNSVFSEKNMFAFRFNACSFVEASFSRCKLARAVFDDCDLGKCQFHNVDLSHADFSTSRNYYMNAESNTLRKTAFSLPEACSLLGNLDIILK